jgi:hypothetical protein
MDLAVAIEAQRHTMREIQQALADPSAFVMDFGCGAKAKFAL